MLSSVIKTLKINYNRRVPKAKIFELGMTYIPVENQKLPDEKIVVALGMYGDVDFFDLKGIVQNLLDDLGIKNAEFEADTESPAYHPGRCAKICAGGKIIGTIGQLHPDIAENLSLIHISNVSISPIDTIPIGNDAARTVSVYSVCLI